ncbi:MAG: hypothetical protein CMJ78_14280 [Planctomycetaceae bacterium]|nr:hypothetical protein [Planctomycetaceae bacterium]
MAARLLRIVTVVALLVSILGQASSFAQDAPAKEAAKPAADQAAGSDASEKSALEKDLATEQEIIRMRFKRFHATLIQMAEYMRKTDPERAELLIRAIGQSQEDAIERQMERIFALLNRKSEDGKAAPIFGDAIERQVSLVSRLEALIDLLQSENRRDEIEAEKARIRDLIKNVKHLIGKEKDLRIATERGGEMDPLSDKQSKIAQDAKKLVKKIDAQDAERNKDGKGSDGKPQDGKPQDGKPQDGKPQDGQQQDGQQQQDDKKTPGRQQIEEARRAMERAIDELKGKKRDDASKSEDEAIQKLVEAKEQLEEILRQLREEEQKLLLATLESRFQKMLSMQLIVYHDTLRIAKVEKSKRNNSHKNQAAKLARDEEEIALEAAKALTILKEEGSSVAFPEAVEGLRDDMLTITYRLDRFQVDDLTQAIEKDVIEALEEIIEALQKELEKLKDKDQQQQQQQQQEGRPRDQPLVDVIAELKMLRSLQLRINRRTKRIGQLIEGEQASDSDLVKQLEQLSNRQQRIQRATFDLATGRNK